MEKNGGGMGGVTVDQMTIAHIDDEIDRGQKLLKAFPGRFRIQGLQNFPGGHNFIIGRETGSLSNGVAHVGLKGLDQKAFPVD
jgi:hypothetical protein